MRPLFLCIALLFTCAACSHGGGGSGGGFTAHSAPLFKEQPNSPAAPRHSRH